MTRPLVTLDARTDPVRWPLFEVAREADGWVVRAFVDALGEDDVEVRVEDYLLIVRLHLPPNAAGQRRWIERRYALPPDVSVADALAQVDDAGLAIEFPRRPCVRSRRIPVLVKGGASPFSPGSKGAES